MSFTQQMFDKNSSSTFYFIQIDSNSFRLKSPKDYLEIAQLAHNIRSRQWGPFSPCSHMRVHMSAS